MKNTSDGGINAKLHDLEKRYDSMSVRVVHQVWTVGSKGRAESLETYLKGTDDAIIVSSLDFEKNAATSRL